MHRTKLIIALALLAARMAAKADSRIAKLWRPDYVREISG